MPGARTFAILPVMLLRYGPVYRSVPLGISVMGWSYAALVVLSLLAAGVGLAFAASWGQVTAASGIVGFLFLCTCLASARADSQSSELVGRS
ncbi:MAG: hypothetical protein R3D32_12475 [Nitratireductor sp.]